MNNQTVLLQLFMRESDSCQNRLLSEIELDYSLENGLPFKRWLAEKRQIVQEDVANTHWIKICTGGYITEVQFHKDGTLDEYRLFDRFATSGTWLLEDGILHVSINKGDNTYTFAVVGNSALNIHSAVEHKNSAIHSYLKLAQIK